MDSFFSNLLLTFLTAFCAYIVTAISKKIEYSSHVDFTIPLFRISSRRLGCPGVTKKFVKIIIKRRSREQTVAQDSGSSQAVTPHREPYAIPIILAPFYGPQLQGLRFQRFNDQRAVSKIHVEKGTYPSCESNKFQKENLLKLLVQI